MKSKLLALLVAILVTAAVTAIAIGYALWVLWLKEHLDALPTTLIALAPVFIGGVVMFYVAFKD